MKDTFPPTRKPSIADFEFIIKMAALGCEAGYGCVVCPSGEEDRPLGEAIAAEIRRRLTPGALSHVADCLDIPVYSAIVNQALAGNQRIQMIDLRDGMYSCLRPDGMARVCHWVKDAMLEMPIPGR